MPRPGKLPGGPNRLDHFFAPGAYAEERIIDIALVRLPDDVPSEIAAGLLTKGVTAWLAVRHLHKMEPGDTVLVQGATGGVGTLVTRWANWVGATIIAVGSSAKRADIAAGANHVLASDEPDLADRIRAVAPEGVDIVYEFVGKATFPDSAQIVRNGGAIFTIGAASGPPDIDQEALAARGLTERHASAAAMVKDAMLRQAAQEVFDHWRDHFRQHRASPLPSCRGGAGPCRHCRPSDWNESHTGSLNPRPATSIACAHHLV